MRLIDIFSTASSNMFRSKLRTLLTIIAIFVGSFTLTLTNGLGAGISSYINQQVANLGAKNVLIIQAGNQGGQLSADKPQKYNPDKKRIRSQVPGADASALNDTDAAKIRAIPGITEVDPALNVVPSYIYGPSGTKYVVSISEFIAGSNLNLAAGSPVDNNSQTNQIIIPVSYVSSLGYSNSAASVETEIKIGISDAFGEMHEVYATITGVQQNGLTGTDSITTNPALLRALYAYQIKGLPKASTDNYQSIYARFSNQSSDSQINALKTKLQKDGYSAQTVQDRIGIFKSVINGIILILDAFAIIALLAASFGIINTLLMSVQERTKEIGLMKALGMGSSSIFLLFSTEAVLLGFWGSLIGVTLAIVSGNIIDRIVSNGFLKDLTGLELLAFPPLSVIPIILIVMIIALLAGTLPAYKAARQNPIDSLRYE